MDIEKYIDEMPLSAGRRSSGRLIVRDAEGNPTQPQLPPDLKAAVDAGSILSFADGIPSAQVADVLYSVQFASRAADATSNRFTQTRAWYGKYIEVLEVAGWTTEQFAFAAHDQTEGELRMDKVALEILSKIAASNNLGAMTASIDAINKLANDDGAITLFSRYAAYDGSGNFQIGDVQKGRSEETLSMALGGYFFRSIENRKNFLFFSWGAKNVNFWTAATKMTLNTAIYGRVRTAIEERLGAGKLDIIAKINL
jgi:hypothetical protein